MLEKSRFPNPSGGTTCYSKRAEAERTLKRSRLQMPTANSGGKSTKATEAVVFEKQQSFDLSEENQVVVDFRSTPSGAVSPWGGRTTIFDESVSFAKFTASLGE